MFRTKERIFKYETFVDAVQNKIPIAQKGFNCRTTQPDILRFSQFYNVCSFFFSIILLA